MLYLCEDMKIFSIYSSESFAVVYVFTFLIHLIFVWGIYVGQSLSYILHMDYKPIVLEQFVKKAILSLLNFLYLLKISWSCFWEFTVDSVRLHWSRCPSRQLHHTVFIAVASLHNLNNGWCDSSDFSLRFQNHCDYAFPFLFAINCRINLVNSTRNSAGAFVGIAVLNL